jgi:hypothetical protein
MKLYNAFVFQYILDVKEQQLHTRSILHASRRRAEVDQMFCDKLTSPNAMLHRSSVIVSRQFLKHNNLTNSPCRTF